MAAPEQQSKAKGIQFYGVDDVYSESGVDLTLLRSNLRRSIDERLTDNRREAEFSLYLWQSNPHRELLRGTRFDRGSNVSDVEKLLRLLTAQNVQFVLIGGQAMRVLGSAHITEDTDICYQRTPANLASLVAALTPIHPYLRGVPPGLPFRFDVPTLEAGLNFTLDTDYGKIDLFGEVSGIGTYGQALAQSVERIIFGFPIRVLSVDGLIAAKKAVSRAKDQSHLLELLELKKILDSTKPATGDTGSAAAR